MLRNNLYAFLLALFGFFISCNEQESVIDPSLPDLPVSLTNLRLSNYVFDTDTISVIPGKEKSRNDPVEVVFSIFVDAALPEDRELESIQCIVLTDAKLSEITRIDLAKVSGISYSGVVRMNIRRGDVGDYRIVVQGTDTRGKETNTVISKIKVLFGAYPPTFCGLSAPDTVDLPSSDFIVLKLKICVDDVSGPDDIKMVIFNSYLPNGQPSSGNPFLMGDDGTRGDEVPNDGVYSLDVQLPSTAIKGKYKFEFQAFDWSNLSSSVKIHHIVVR